MADYNDSDDERPIISSNHDSIYRLLFWQRSDFGLGRDQSAFYVAHSTEQRTASEPNSYRQTHDDEIRVFILYPAQRDDPLQGHLHYVRAAEPFQYTAISYCWGQTDMTCSVRLPDKQINATTTVDRILRVLRHQEHSVHIWIDQLCINQTDDSDKETQVKLMAQIYSQAFDTLIYLGEGPEDGAFRLMQGFSELSYGLADADQMKSQGKFLENMTSESTVAFNALTNLFSHQWFQRTWVIQEAILSRNPYIMFGSETISWRDFAGYCVDVAGFNIFDRPNGCNIMSDIFTAREMHIAMQEPPNLFFWLEITRYAAVSLPIDKVYGVMGLCRDTLPIDYSISSDQVFQQVAEQALQDSKHLAAFFSCVDHDPEESNLPSWVIDWSKPRVTKALANKTFCLAYYKAGGSEPFVSLRNRLTIKGVFYAMIEKCSEIATDAELTQDPDRNIALRQAIDFSSQCNDFESFCATLVAGRDASTLKPYPKEYIEILSLLCDETSGRKPTFEDQVYTIRQSKGHFSLDHLSKRKPGRIFANLQTAFRDAILFRRLAWIGEIALVPRYTKVGDEIVVISGCPVPYVLRKKRDGYMLIGECYIHSIMDGKWFLKNQNKIEDIEIV